ncbi:MAG: hypothetical protein HYX67_05345 [Candidatus Melainabacteria bacterium]|nr:hypothetical protein [Candidatus Melainabacteria bacterium]
MSEQDCLQARQTVDDTSAFTAEQLLGAEQHIRNCVPCETWRSQVNVIAAAAKEMTFFDVPESLTQRIMADVQETSSSSALTMKTLILSCVVIAASVSVFSFESFDTINGVISWLIGFVMLFGFKYLIQVNARNDARFQNQN